MKDTVDKYLDYEKAQQKFNACKTSWSWRVTDAAERWAGSVGESDISRARRELNDLRLNTELPRFSPLIHVANEAIT